LDVESEKNRQIEKMTLDSGQLVAKLRKQIEELQSELEEERLRNSTEMSNIENAHSKRMSHLK